MYKCMLCMSCAEIFPLIRMPIKRAILLFVLGHFINFFITWDALRGHTVSKNGSISCYLHPPPPIEGFCVYPYQKYLLLLKTPSEIKIKVRTHSPLGKKKEFKDTDIHAPSAQKLLFKTPSPPSDFSVFQRGGGKGADIKWDGGPLCPFPIMSHALKFNFNPPHPQKYPIKSTF